MIVCGKCGTRNEEGDAFCGSCGAFLEWEGRKVAAEPEPALVGAEEAEEEHKGLVERVVDRFTGMPAGVDLAEESDAGEPDRLEVAVVSDDGAEAAAVLAAEAEERARLAAEAAERAREEAEERARREAEAADAARREAEEAEQARMQAQETAVTEAAEAERLRAELEEAESSRAAAQAELERERAALEQLKAETEQAIRQEAELAQQQAEERLAAERAAVEQARAEAEAAEAARRAAEERAQAEAEAAKAAARQAAEAEQARQAAEAKAAEETEAAKRAQRAAALVAKPKPKQQPVERTEAVVAQTATSDGSQASAEVKPVKPTKRKVRPVTPKKPPLPPTKKIRPGQLICGNCGEGNDPERNFCRRCGQTLKDAEVARAPWWRRLPLRRRKVYAAGERRGRRGKGTLGKGREAKRKFLRAFAMIARASAVLALLGVGAMSIGPWRPTVMNWAGDRLSAIRQIVMPEFDPVRPTGAQASSERDGHPAAHVIDGESNSWWAGASPAPGAESSILLTFPQPVDIAVVGITSGASDVSEFSTVDRPAKLHLLFDNGFDVELEIADRHEFQSFEIDDAQAAGVSSVLVRIAETHAGLPDVAITELEFRTKRRASSDG